jgi:hypothetical protein
VCFEKTGSMAGMNTLRRAPHPVGDRVTGSRASVRHEVAVAGRVRAHSPGSYLLLLPGVTGEGATLLLSRQTRCTEKRPVSNEPARYQRDDLALPLPANVASVVLWMVRHRLRRQDRNLVPCSAHRLRRHWQDCRRKGCPSPDPSMALQRRG